MKLRVTSVVAFVSILISMGVVHVAEGVRPMDPCAFPCFEDFDDGVFDHSSLQFSYPAGSTKAWPNLWHISSVCADAPSLPNYLAFNDDATCKYPEGVRTAGGIRLSVDLSNTSSAFLRYREYLEVETHSSYDRPWVRASRDGVDWMSLVDPSYARPRGWRTVGLNLTPLAGQGTVFVEWWFDTVDPLFNNTLGWIIDDIRIDSHPLCAANDARSSACSIRMLPAGNHQSTIGFTTEAGEVAGCLLSGATAWYEYTHKGLDTFATVDTRGSNFDTVVAVFDGDVPLGCKDEHDEMAYVFGKRNPQAVYSFPVLAGRTYRLQIGGLQGATGSLLLEVRSGFEPTI